MIVSLTDLAGRPHNAPTYPNYTNGRMLLDLGVFLKGLRSWNSASERRNRQGRRCPRRHDLPGRLRLGRLGRARFSSHADPVYFRNTP
jgi:hypothetical protein